MVSKVFSQLEEVAQSQTYVTGEGVRVFFKNTEELTAVKTHTRTSRSNMDHFSGTTQEEIEAFLLLLSKG